MYIIQYVCIYMHTHPRMHTHTHVCIYRSHIIYMYINTHNIRTLYNMYAYICTRTHARTHTRTHTHTYTPTHTHTHTHPASVCHLNRQEGRGRLQVRGTKGPMCVRENTFYRVREHILLRVEEGFKCGGPKGLCVREREHIL